MMISNQEQLQRLFFCLGFGVWLSLLNDFLRILRVFSKPTKSSMLCQDILLCLIGGICLFLFSLAISGGQIRAVMIAAVTIGFFSARLTIGRFILTIVRRFARTLPAVEKRFRRSYSRLQTVSKKILKKIGIFLKKGLHPFRILVYNKKQE